MFLRARSRNDGELAGIFGESPWLVKMKRIIKHEFDDLPRSQQQRIADGESPLRVYRQYRGLSQAALSDLSGIPTTQISDMEAVEAGRRKPMSSWAIGKLSPALGLPIEVLFTYAFEIMERENTKGRTR